MKSTRQDKIMEEKIRLSLDAYFETKGIPIFWDNLPLGGPGIAPIYDVDRDRPSAFFDREDGHLGVPGNILIDTPRRLFMNRWLFIVPRGRFPYSDTFKEIKQAGDALIVAVRGQAEGPYKLVISCVREDRIPRNERNLQCDLRHFPNLTVLKSDHAAVFSIGMAIVPNLDDYDR